MTNAIIRFSLALALVATSSPLRAQEVSPGRLTATATGPTTVSLTWTAAEEATRYWVQRGVGAGDLANLSTPKISGTAYTDASAPAGTMLRYRVMAGFTRGSNTYSAVVSVTTPTTPATAASTPTASPGQPSLGIETAAPASTVTQANQPAHAVDPPSTINTAEMARQARLPQGGAPQGLTATALSPTSIRLSWTPIADATGYYVYRGATADASTPPIATVPPPFTAAPAAVSRQRMLQVVVPVTYVDGGVMPHATAYYRVAATYDAQKAGTSDVVSATTPAAQQPTGLFAISGPGSVTLSWHPAPGATSYSVNRAIYAFDHNCYPGLNKNQQVRDTTYTDEKLPPCNFVYRVMAYYTVQGVGEVGADLSQIPAVAATPRPAAPTDLHFAPYYGGSVVDLRWTHVSGASGYKILRALASDGNFAEVPGVQYWGWAGVGWNNYLNYEFVRDPTAQIGQTYLYKLIAYHYNDTPGESNAVRIVVKGKLPGIQDLTGSSPASQTIELHWTPPPGAQGFVIRRGSGNSEQMGSIGRAEPPLDLAGNASSYTDKYLFKGKTYQYQVVTWYGGDNWGEEASTEVTTQ